MLSKIIITSNIYIIEVKFLEGGVIWQKEVDVYQTKYYYYIDRWVYKRSIDTSGTDKNPYFGEITLGYNERKNGTTTSYSIDVINSNGEAKTYSISEENWRKIDKGDTLDVEISKLGTLTNIINIQKD